MGLIKGLLFWGYVDDEGVIHVKRYKNDREIANYELLPFCKGIFEVFEAYSIEEARLKCHERYKQE